MVIFSTLIILLLIHLLLFLSFFDWKTFHAVVVLSFIVL
jgi:hypothetical protein